MIAILDELGPNPQVVNIDNGDDDLGHLWCCKKTLAMCGVEIDGDDSDSHIPDEYLCVVCNDLNAYPCPHCGALPPT